MKPDPKSPERHAWRMEKKQQIMRERIANADKDQGILLVLTGSGKGNSSSGFGMLARALGHGMKVGVVQFIKGGMDCGERDLITAKFADLCEFYTMGEGFTWETQNKDRDIEMAQAAWEKAKELIRNPENKMVLLDEINIALRYDYIDVNDVVAFLSTEKPPLTHVVLTGRNAKDELIEIADLVTEMELVKHPFRSGIKAQIGVEY